MDWARRRSWVVVAGAILFGLGLTFVALRGDEPRDKAASSADVDQSKVTARQPQVHVTPLQVSVDMVIVNVTVTDPYDRIVQSLEHVAILVADGDAADAVAEAIAATDIS